ncbi:patatin-like phospholipase family protein [Litoribaculum gwangyangense]|uniref:Patatin-like phospholipase family protein n=1 Tax=Litoribaculum gwangyangense TaxID=1130722 RepID=A0ABP9C8A1_9FLAO
MNQKIGLVLSGGGVRAIAHIGLVKVLLEHDIVPTHVSGTSAGALVSALYANGYNTDEMIQFFKQTPILDFSLYALKKPGLLDSEKYIRYFNKFFTENSFEKLKYPLTITATNLLSGRLEYFSEGELIKPLIASCALPPLFSPLKINDNLYSDGGILNNFPVEPLKKQDVPKIVGSFVNPITTVKASEINTSLKLIYRVYHLGLETNNIKKFKLCNYVFEPKPIDKIGTLETKSIDAAFEIGYNQAKKEIDGILKSLE